jgi:hypothetical protein
MPVQGSVRLVAGNTGYGIYKEWLPEDHLIDIKQVPELRRLSLSKASQRSTYLRSTSCRAHIMLLIYATAAVSYGSQEVLPWQRMLFCWQ